MMQQQGMLRPAMVYHLNLGTEATHVTSIQSTSNQEAILVQPAWRKLVNIPSVKYRRLGGSCLGSTGSFSQLLYLTVHLPYSSHLD